MSEDPSERRLVARLNDDQSIVEIEFLPASGVTGTMNLTEAQLTKLISGLGKVRAAMISDKPAASLTGGEVNVVFNTQWYVQPEPLTESSAMIFDHPSFGVVGFAIPRDQIQEIVRLLTAHLGILPSVPDKIN